MDEELYRTVKVDKGGVLDDVPDSDYLSVLRPLLQQKRRSTKARSDYELNLKLVKYAMSRGFSFPLIRRCMDVDVEMEAADDETEFLE